MRYLCLMYGDGSSMDTHTDWDADLRRTGNLVSICAVDPGQPAITVKTRNGNIVTYDGPLFDDPCLLHTCVVIDARDLNDAIRMTAKFPGAERACIEIRPLSSPGCA